MATTKIWPIRDSLARVLDYAANPDKTGYDDLKAVLHYAADGSKTTVGQERALLVTGVNCRAETALREMTAVKERFGKTGGNVAYHAYQSFKPGEVTPEECHRLGLELARRMWGEEYQVLVATHLNTGTYHNHFVINSVGMWTGRKFNDSKRTYARLRQLSDEICREHELSVIENPAGKTPRALYFAEKAGEPTKYNLMREALDAALTICTTAAELTNAMRDQGYILEGQPNHKYITIRRISDSKPTRTFRLGNEYTKEAINRRLMKNQSRWLADLNYRRYQSPKPRQSPTPHDRAKGVIHPKSSLRGLYLRYCCCLGILPKNSPRKPLSPEMKEECRRLDRYDRQVRLLVREKLETREDVEEFISRQKERVATLSAQRQGCYNKLRRCSDPEEIARIKAERDKLTKAIAACRREAKTAEDILAQASRMKTNLRIEQGMMAQRQGITRTKKERSRTR